MPRHQWIKTLCANRLIFLSLFSCVGDFCFILAVLEPVSGEWKVNIATPAVSTPSAQDMADVLWGLLQEWGKNLLTSELPQATLLEPHLRAGDNLSTSYLPDN